MDDIIFMDSILTKWLLSGLCWKWHKQVCGGGEWEGGWWGVSNITRMINFVSCMCYLFAKVCFRVFFFFFLWDQSTIAPHHSDTGRVQTVKLKWWLLYINAKRVVDNIQHGRGKRRLCGKCKGGAKRKLITDYKRWNETWDFFINSMHFTQCLTNWWEHCDLLLHIII